MKPIYRIALRIFISLLSFFLSQSMFAQNWTFVLGIKAQDIAEYARACKKLLSESDL